MPVGTAAPPDSLQNAIVSRYASTFADPLMQGWFDDSGFANFGYWRDGPETATEASCALVERLVGMSPASLRTGAALDVACGAGATTRELSRYFDPSRIVGINIAQDQLDRAAHVAPGVSFRNMDATSLDFPTASFDVVICVEASHHFDTRARFLAEAYRVLKPGGYLVLSDVLFGSPVGAFQQLKYRALTTVFAEPPRDYPLANVVPNIAAAVHVDGVPLHIVGDRERRFHGARVPYAGAQRHSALLPGGPDERR